ncbi:alpha/beta hydrolase [Blastococcus tunisiensis]|uniref:alpha/beta hydrolase n=1 Tax=Blastococcus tunisiensis TaxID=1798228 RepID=UPI0020C85305|nr:alpha/beta hydrolase [Blastococcus sp. DSM 46838]
MADIPAADAHPGVTVRSDLVYATERGVELHLDLYLPATRPAPLCLWLHGGGWVRGSRTARAAERLVPMARNGMAVAAVQYRFSGEAPFPAQLDDVRAAVRWLRRNAADLALDAERIGAWGASAGGHLAALLALCPDERDRDLGDSSVQAAVCWYPITDLTRRETDVPEGPLPSFATGPPMVPPPEARLLGVESLRQAAAAAAASPITHVHPGAPPFLLMHGDRDGWVPSEQSRALHRALQVDGVPTSLLLLAGANHEDPAFETPSSLAAVAAFLRSALLPEPHRPGDAAEAGSTAG